jgi:uncharacterized protein
MVFHVMLVPTLGCPSNCGYCWSSEEGSEMMSIDTLKQTVNWLKTLREDSVTVTFHGGEPLLAGLEFFETALPLIKNELSHLKPALAIQTNLWNMTDDIAELFSAYNIPIGSSIDGPEELNDYQRGKGYYQKTMHGYQIAKAHNLKVSFICTFTSYSIQQKEAILNYFLENDLTLKLHPSLPSMRDDNPDEWALSPEDYGELLVYLLEEYLDKMDEVEIMNIDNLAKSVFRRRGTVCTYVDCMGDTFAIGPDGSIYPCYRFVGMPDYVMGNVHDNPTLDDLAESKSWKLLMEFKDFVDEECKRCNYIKFCRGGCPYNALAITDAKVESVDPHCTAYKRIFKEITDKATREMLSGSLMGNSKPSKATKYTIMDLMLKESR